jgi:type II secretory ATPase GspE/PulE/Tfp pilus assembly ATPase PilB-like protein
MVDRGDVKVDFGDADSGRTLDVAELDVEESVQRLVNHAVRLGASDLFFESHQEFVAVGVRRLGMIERISILGLEHGLRCIQSIKAAAEMDVAERRRPNDGRWVVEVDDEPVDLRLNTIPTLHGEDLSIRLLRRDVGLMELDQLGFSADQLKAVRGMIDSPSGLIVFTGPTGSGKTASMYAAVRKLNDGKRRINTIEDPIEFAVDGLRQSQVNSNLDLDFAALLKSILRQSPDVIMIGEIRDAETAATSIRAAISGHLVLATMHAPVAAQAVESLLALGVQPHFFASCLRGVVAQRLVRTMDPEHRREFPLDDEAETFEEVRDLLEPGEGKTLYAPDGEHGYSGRTAIFEVMNVNKQLRRMISNRATAAELHAEAIDQGMLDFRKAALLKVARGETTIEEVFRVIPSEHLLLEE